MRSFTAQFYFYRTLKIKSIDTQNKNSNNSDSSTQSADTNGFAVNKKGFIEMKAEVIELLPAATFKLALENGQEILAHLSGKMRMNRILLLVGDNVKVEMSPYDLTKGRITYRF